jgi:hypothetical protein
LLDRVPFAWWFSPDESLRRRPDQRYCMPQSFSPPPRVFRPRDEASPSDPPDDPSGVHELASVRSDSCGSRLRRPSQRPTPPLQRLVPLHPDDVTRRAPGDPDDLLAPLRTVLRESSNTGAEELPSRILAFSKCRMLELFSDGDYEGAVEAAQHVLACQPDDADAASYLRTCERLIGQRHVERLGDLRAVPRLIIPQDQVRCLALDHREGFVLALIDGRTSIEDILDIAGMNRVDVLRMIAWLLDADVIAIT